LGIGRSRLGEAVPDEAIELLLLLEEVFRRRLGGSGTMGMYDEVYCYALLLDGREPRDNHFGIPVCVAIGSDRESGDNEAQGRLRGGASIAHDSCPDSFKISYELTKTGLIASVTGWLRFDGSSRNRFSLAIRMRHPTRARIT
jgi:hypothetical protein